MPSCYLTIDDSPSLHTDAMIDFLIERCIPALLFCRGDLMEQNPAPIIRAIQKGFVIGNHSYAHKPYGGMDYVDCIDDIEQCETQIQSAYRASGIKRQGKYFRFPYLDRGNGDRIERHFDSVTDIDINTDAKVKKIQDYLKSNNFVQPFHATSHPVYNNPSIKNASDCLMTFTSFDWMLSARHVGKWDFKTINDLKSRIDNDKNLNQSEGNILIFHDQNETLETFKTLIDHMILKGYEFLSY